MRLAFLLSDLGLGGAQRVASLLAGEFASQGHEVAIITLNAGPALFPLPQQVQRIALGQTGDTCGLWAKITANLGRLAAVRRALREFRPDGVIAFITPVNVMALLAGLGCGWLTVVSERSDPKAQPWPLPWRLLRRLCYPLAAAVVMQTAKAAAALPCYRRKLVIANPVIAPAFDGTAASLPRPCLLAAGRLSWEKGFDLLLAAFAKLRDRHPSWTLAIAGEGEERAALEAQISALALQERVSLLGFRSDMGALLAAAEIFVLPSRFEGFPNALCEAMAAGKAVVAADCPSGPADLIRHNENGLLTQAEDVETLACALDRLMTDVGLRYHLGEQAKGLSQQFSLAATADQWLTLIQQCISPFGSR